MIKERVELSFQDTDGAIRFGASEMANVFREVVHKWPLTNPAPETPAFAEVQQEASRWAVDIHYPDPRRKTYNPVNGICELIVELNWSRLRQNLELLCLHAAGVRMNDMLVVFPSGRRAGKSTLTTELARRGYEVFSDDILAAHLDGQGVASGLATGIAPRLRLPLPNEASDEFCDWVHADPGPANAQYKYLTHAPVAEYGTSCAVGAIITLDRQDDDITPKLNEISLNEVLPILLHQNFGRFSHSGQTLAALGAMANDLPCFRLSYGNFGRAADHLEAVVRSGILQSKAVAHPQHVEEPNFDRVVYPFDGTRQYRQRSGFFCIQTGNEAIISDADGVGIFRMGQGMMPVWALLEEPMTHDQVCSILIEVFPDTDSATLFKDTEAALRALNNAGLIETDDTA